MTRYFPISGPASAIHICTDKKKAMLCGRYPRRYTWECVYGSEVFPEIKGLSTHKGLTHPDFVAGLRVGEEHAPKAYFCKKCYAKYLEVANALALQSAAENLKNALIDQNNTQ